MEKDNSYLLEIFDIAKYAVSIEDEKVYRRAKEMLMEELYAYIQEQLNSKETKKRGICFTEVQIDLMKQVLNMTCKSDNNFFSHDSFLINMVLSYPICSNFRRYMANYLVLCDPSCGCRQCRVVFILLDIC